MKAKSVYNSPGYTKQFELTAEEHEKIKGAIQSQWIQCIKQANLSTSRELKEAKIEKYHTMAESSIHNELFPKLNRVLNEEFVKWFLDSSFIKNLDKEFGSFEVSDEEKLGRPNFYWRLTRPGIKTDVGSLHRDCWFWELNKSTFKKPKYAHHRVKVWIAINVESGKNGLLLEKNSHKRADIKFTSIKVDKKKKPILDETTNTEEVFLENVGNGGSIVFNDKLLHGGATNNGSECRISLEFTMLVKGNEPKGE